MSFEADGEVEFEVATSDDAKVVTITMTAKREITFQELLENLDMCYRELKRAYEQKKKPGVREH